jgi:undecaprenyl diphosphate synthase
MVGLARLTGGGVGERVDGRPGLDENYARGLVEGYAGRYTIVSTVAKPRKSPLDGAVAYPRNVAIIADGHRRWARTNGISIERAYEQGVQVAKAHAYAALELGLRQLVMFTFSTENWRRPAGEVDALMRIFSRGLETETPGLVRAGVRIRFIGRREGVREAVAEQMRASEAMAARNDAMTLFFAFNYGGRAEILDAARRYEGGGEEEWRRCLYAPDMDEPDAIIRTGGDKRLSNFLLWQAAYAELVFRDEFWPEFSRAAFEESLVEASNRRRRFGGRDALGEAALRSAPDGV